jgi:hypothetical protein
MHKLALTFVALREGLRYGSGNVRIAICGRDEELRHDSEGDKMDPLVRVPNLRMRASLRLTACDQMKWRDWNGPHQPRVVTVRTKF